MGRMINGGIFLCDLILPTAVHCTSVVKPGGLGGCGEFIFEDLK